MKHCLHLMLSPVLLLLLVSCSVSKHNLVEEPTRPVKIVSLVHPINVVQKGVDLELGEQYACTGFMIDRYFGITAAHCIINQELGIMATQAIVADYESGTSGRIVDLEIPECYFDSVSPLGSCDFAVFEVDSPVGGEAGTFNVKLPPVEFKGKRVESNAFLFDQLHNTVKSKGKVLAHKDNMVSTDQAVQPGMSGGALLFKGSAVGVLVATGVNYSVCYPFRSQDIEYIERFVDERKWEKERR